MAAPPIPLQVGGDQSNDYNVINDNFNNVVQNVKDLGANVSTIGTLTNTITATSLNTAVFTLTSTGTASPSANQVFTQSPVSQVSGIAPLVDIYVDVDNDETHRFPVGSALTSGQLALFVLVQVMNTPYTNSLGAWSIGLNNRDGSTHTYYIHTKCGYFPSTASIFR